MLHSYVMLAVLNVLLASDAASGQITGSNPVSMEGDHNNPVWADIERHLPDIATSSREVLESEGDLLRARHYTKDALGFYQATLSRFGETSALLNKVGMTHIELRNVVLAESYFRRAIKKDSRNWESWNNLAAIASVQHQYEEAVSGYKRAIKIDPANAVSHVNLCTLYFELKQYDKAVREAAEALRVDANAFSRGEGFRIAPRALPAEERARTFYEMAKFFAEIHLETEMLRELAKVHESGIDLLTAMSKNPSLSKYVDDPRVRSMLAATKELGRADSYNATSVSSVDPHTAPLDAIK